MPRQPHLSRRVRCRIQMPLPGQSIAPSRWRRCRKTSRRARSWSPLMQQSSTFLRSALMPRQPHLSHRSNPSRRASCRVQRPMSPQPSAPRRVRRSRKTSRRAWSWSPLMQRLPTQPRSALMPRKPHLRCPVQLTLTLTLTLPLSLSLSPRSPAPRRVLRLRKTSRRARSWSPLMQQLATLQRSAMMLTQPHLSCRLHCPVQLLPLLSLPPWSPAPSRWRRCRKTSHLARSWSVLRRVGSMSCLLQPRKRRNLCRAAPHPPQSRWWRAHPSRLHVRIFWRSRCPTRRNSMRQARSSCAQRSPSTAHRSCRMRFLILSR